MRRTRSRRNLVIGEPMPNSEMRHAHPQAAVHSVSTMSPTRSQVLTQTKLFDASKKCWKGGPQDFGDMCLGLFHYQLDDADTDRDFTIARKRDNPLIPCCAAGRAVGVEDRSERPQPNRNRSEP